MADITYVLTDAGYLYLSVVLDAFSRRIVGWAMADHLRTELVLGAPDMAIQQRSPEETIHHSDQGCQYTAIAFGQQCKDARVRPSMDSVGDCYDNALVSRARQGSDAVLYVERRADMPARSPYGTKRVWHGPHP